MPARPRAIQPKTKTARGTPGRKWATSDAIIEDVHGVFLALRSGEVPVEDARAAVNALKTAAKVVEIELEHAKVTNRLTTGSNELPGFVRV